LPSWRRRWPRARGDARRRAELLTIADTCRRVPAQPARSFREGLQAFWFLFLVLNPSPTAAAGRFDQYLFPLYRDDRAAGRLTREQAVELLGCLRIKDMQLNRVSGAANRKKNSGLAKWHNWTIGGQTADGRDASNELSHLVLEAALAVPVPHHTITLRVHAGTPDALMLKALQVVRSGLGLPAFVGDESYIRFFTGHGVPLEQARDYILTGCLDANLPAQSRTSAIGMFIVPLVLQMFLHDGVDPNTGLQVGPPGARPECDDGLRRLRRRLQGAPAPLHGAGGAQEQHRARRAARAVPRPRCARR
jgi:pyruvate-formate lyase